LESLTKDAGHVTIILFSLLLGGMVGVIAKSGASWAIAEKVSRYATTPRRGQLIGWVLGLLIFFDDYANALICGSTLRPITDRLRISREKLAYIVDSTAAPVASLAIISTWIGTEIGYIGDQLTTLGIEGDPYLLFLKTIPFRFYPILALFLGFMVAATGRDFGPMAAAEVRARRGEGVVRKGAALLTEFAEEETRKRSGVWYHAAIPIAVVVFVMLGGLYVTGWQAVNGGKDLHVETLLGQAAAPTALNLLAATWLGFLVFLMFAAIVVKKQGFRLDNPRGRWYLLILDTIALGGILILLHETYGFVTTCPASLREIFGRADSYAALIWASFLGSITALLLVTGERVMRLRQAIEAWLSGMKSMMLAVVVLTLAWSLGSICSDLQTSAYLVGLLEGSFPPKLLPMMVFAVSAAISFATGTSWGTMGILFPIVVPLAHHLAPGNELILVGTISSILAGSVFGDHCSPISDTTIMSSMASSSDHIDHVKTQIPYALLAGIVGMILGDLATACHLYGAWTALFLSGGVITLFLFLFGRKVDAPPPK
ncbi:MAG: Na+/H+ antiporter NhaC family protein, partial [Deltaproteobacteria bacterium]